MAVNFKLFDKQTKEEISLVKIDELICQDVFHCTPHSKWWGGEVFNWYDTIGFQLACGLELEDGHNSVREHYKNSEMWKEEFPLIDSVISYLQESYTSKSWSS
jgi:hypothetical protein